MNKKPSKPLTKAQRNILLYAMRYVTRYCNFPSNRQIGERFGMTQAAALCHLRLIAKKGYISQQMTPKWTILYDHNGDRVNLTWVVKA